MKDGLRRQPYPANHCCYEKKKNSCSAGMDFLEGRRQTFISSWQKILPPKKLQKTTIHQPPPQK